MKRFLFIIIFVHLNDVQSATLTTQLNILMMNDNYGHFNQDSKLMTDNRFEKSVKHQNCGLQVLNLDNESIKQRNQQSSNKTTSRRKFNNNRRVGKVVGGQLAYEGEFPWTVSIRKLDAHANAFNHHCGGVIISEFWVLTGKILKFNKI